MHCLFNPPPLRPQLTLDHSQGLRSETHPGCSHSLASFMKWRYWSKSQLELRVKGCHSISYGNVRTTHLMGSHPFSIVLYLLSLYESFQLMYSMGHYSPSSTWDKTTPSPLPTTLPNFWSWILSGLQLLLSYQFGDAPVHGPSGSTDTLNCTLLWVCHNSQLLSYVVNAAANHYCK